MIQVPGTQGQDPKPQAAPQQPIRQNKPPADFLRSLRQANGSPEQLEPPSDLWSRLQANEKRRDDASANRAFENVGLAIEGNPDLRAEAQDIARQLGVDPDAVSRNRDVMVKLARQRQIADMRIAENNPVLAKRMAELEFARIAHDDAESLSDIEAITQNWEAGKLEAEGGMLGSRLIFGEHTPAEKERMDWIKGRLSKLSPQRGFVSGSARILGQQAITFPTAVKGGIAGAALGAAWGASGGPLAPETVPGGALAGFGAGFLSAMAQQSFQIEAGSTYSSMIEQGYDPAVAGRLSVAYGVGAATLETMGEFWLAKGAGLVSGPLKRALLRDVSQAIQQKTSASALRDLAKGWAVGVSGETATETAQQALQIVAEDLARRFSPGDLESTVTRGEVIQQLVDTTQQVFEGMALLAVPGPLASFGVNMRQVAQSQQRMADFAKLIELTQKSKLAGRSPDAFGAFVNDASENGASAVYLDARKVAQVLQQLEIPPEDFAKVAPEAAAELEAQAAAGGDIVIPTGDYLAKVSRSDLHAALEPHIRLDPDDPSAAEIEEAKPLAKEIEAEIQAQVETATTFTQSARAVELAILQRIGGAVQEGQLDIDQGQRRTAAAVMRAYIEQLALNTGVTPEQAFAANNVTVGYAEKAAGQTVQQLPNSPEFYSALAVEVEALPTRSATPAGWKQSLKGLVNNQKNDVKQAEIEWTGLQDFLDLPREGKVTKEEVVAFLQGNGVRVETVQLSDDISSFAARQNLRDTVLNRGFIVQDDGFGEVLDRGTEDVVVWRDLPEDVQDAIQELRGDEDNVPNIAGRTKFGQWQLPGGTNYREVLLTLPVKPAEFATVQRRESDGMWIVVDPDGAFLKDSRNEEVARQHAADFNRAVAEDKKAFRSSHFDQPNIVAHLRLNDRTDTDGNRVLFVEEVQSDWGQKGRDRGFTRQPTKAQQERLVAVIEEEAPIRQRVYKHAAKKFKARTVGGGWGDLQLWDVSDDSGNLLGEGKGPDDIVAIRWMAGQHLVAPESHPWIKSALSEADYKRLVDLKAEEKRLTPVADALPAAPFVETTEGWLNLALKKVMQLAVEGGYDKVAFINGEQSAERYDLSKQVDEITYRRFEKVDGAFFDIDVFKGGEQLPMSRDMRNIPLAKLPDVVGKEVAQKMDANEGDQGSLASNERVLRGNDLKVGGEGMRAFYDKIVPKAVAKLAKKVGAETGVFDLEPEIGPGVQTSDGNLSTISHDEARTMLRAGDVVYYAREAEMGTDYVPTSGRGAEILLRDDRQFFKPSEGATAKGEQLSFTVTDKMRAEVGKGLPLFQEGEADARASVDLSTLAVALHKKADVSSLLHEFSHTFLQIHLNVVAQQLANPEKIGSRRMQEDAETLLDWFGIASEAGSLQERLAVWQAMSLDQQRKHHEAFAYNFESYLFGAKAPSLKMEGVFRRFATWLRRIYRDVRTRLNDLYKSQFGTDLPALTPEVRGVFDRMLAAEEDIAQAEAVRNVAPTFQTVEEFVASGRTEAEWGDYQAALADAHDAAVLDLTRASLRQMKWLEGARSRALKALQREGKAERAIVRDQVAPEVAAQPVHRLRQWLRTGKFVDESGLLDAGEIDPNHKLRREDVEAMNLGEAETQVLNTHLSRAGQPADIVGRLFGYESGEAMARDLLAAPVLKDAIEAAVDQRMMAEFAEFTPGTPQHQEAIERALHNEARARFVAVEMKFLTGATQPVRVMVAAARMAARAKLDRTAVKDIRPRDFAVAEARAAREAMKAVKDGDSVAAIDAKRRQLLQSQLAREAIKAQEEIQAGLREAHKFRGSDTRLAKTRDVNLVAVGRAILAAFQMGPTASKAMPHLERVKEYNPTLYAELAPIVARATEAKAPYKTISLAEFREVIDTIKSLWWSSKREREMLIGGKRVSRDEIKAKLIAQFVKRGFAAPVGADRSPTRKQKVLRSFGSIRAGLRHVESWAVEMDGGKPGDVHRYLFLPLRDKFTDYLVEKNERVKEFHQRLHALKLSGVQIDAPALGYTFKGKAQLLGALLQAGNESNMEKNLLAREWATRLPDGTIDSSRWWQFIQEQADRGTITKADLEFVQWVWDQYETLLPRAQTAHFENYGRYFDRIPARAFTVKVGGEVVEMRGGYVPAKPDVNYPGYQPPKQDPNGDGVFETSRDFQDSRTNASTGKAFTIDRTKIIRALNMDLQMHEVAMDEELRFIHMQRVGRDLGALLHDKEFSGVLNQVNPDIVQETIYPWLRDTLQNRIMQPGLNKGLTQSLVFLRRNTGAALMFANVSNSLMQLTGVGASLSIVKLKHMRASAAQFLSGPGKMAEGIVEKSDFMRLRLRQQIGQIIDDIDVVTNPTWLGKTQDWVNRHAYFMQSWMQNPVDIITWGGAHDQAIVEGLSEVEAVQAADSAVRRTQGSGTAADVSKFERGSPHVRVIMQFSTFWLSALNLVMERPTDAAKIRTTALLLGIVGISAGAISQAMRGGWDDEDEDGALWDDVTGWAFGETLQTAASIGVPVIGPAFLRLMSGPSAGRLSFGATIGQLERAGRVFMTARQFAFDPGRELRGSDIKDIGSFASLATGIPFSVLAKPAAFVREKYRGNVDSGGFLESAAGALVGRTR